MPLASPGLRLRRSRPARRYEALLLARRSSGSAAASAFRHHLACSACSHRHPRATRARPTAAGMDRGVKFIAKTQREEKVAQEVALRQFCLLALNLNEFVYLE